MFSFIFMLSDSFPWFGLMNPDKWSKYFWIKNSSKIRSFPKRIWTKKKRKTFHNLFLRNINVNWLYCNKSQKISIFEYRETFFHSNGIYLYVSDEIVFNNTLHIMISGLENPRFFRIIQWLGHFLVGFRNENPDKPAQTGQTGMFTVNRLKCHSCKQFNKVRNSFLSVQFLFRSHWNRSSGFVFKCFKETFVRNSMNKKKLYHLNHFAQFLGSH